MNTFTDAPTGLQICRDKLQFLCDAFSQPHVIVFELSEEGTSGLFFIMQDVATDIERISRMQEVKS